MQSTIITHKKKIRTKKHGDGYDVETVFFYYSLAGGCINKAFITAAEVGDRRVPKDRGTWYSCAKHFDFEQRYRHETKQQQDEFHEERERVHRYMMDLTAEAFEQFLAVHSLLMQRFNKEILEGKFNTLQFLRNDSPYSIKNLDRMFRMYLRAMGKPEKVIEIAQNRSPLATTFKTYTKQQREELLRKK